MAAVYQCHSTAYYACAGGVVVSGEGVVGCGFGCGVVGSM